jgi:hypothetical protein
MKEEDLGLAPFFELTFKQIVAQQVICSGPIGFARYKLILVTSAPIPVAALFLFFGKKSYPLGSSLESAGL